MKHSWEYLSLHYLDMWLGNDQFYHASLNSENCEEKLDCIKKALTHYKVARNLPRVYDAENGIQRYEPILNIIDEVSACSFADNTVESITNVKRRISEAYGNRGVLSITTKLLWLKIRTPIIMYDSRSCQALNTDARDFSGFYTAWKNEYEKHEKNIAKACTKLSRVSKYSCDQTIANPAYVKCISAKPWFQERVFDMYLWHKGGGKNQPIIPPSAA